METKRIIPCLDVKDGRVVKGIKFVQLRDAGDPVECGKAYDKAGADGLTVSIGAVENVLGQSGRLIMSLSVILFAFGTLISWSYYGEKSIEYLTGGKYVKAYRLVYAAATFIGCVTEIDLIWEISDTFNGLIAIPNLLAIILLSRQVLPPKKE